MLFSGVTWPYSAMTMASYAGSLKVFLSVQVPKYSLPLALIFASREVTIGQEAGGVLEGGGGGGGGAVGVDTGVEVGLGTTERGLHCEYHSLKLSQTYPVMQVVGPVYPIPPPRTISNRIYHACFELEENLH